jgi:hypothetical protein
MRNRDSYGVIATGIVVVAAVLMAVVAVVALANRSPARVKLTRAQRPLVARLAVLRRAQTAGDRSGHFSGPILPGLTRLVATLPGNWGLGTVRVFLVVRRHDGIGTVTLYGRNISLEGGSTSANLHRPRDVTRGLVYSVGVVPDGVTQVRWVFRSHFLTAGGRRRRLIIDPMVRNNVAIAPVVDHQGQLVRATWYGRDGRVFRP